MRGAFYEAGVQQLGACVHSTYTRPTSWDGLAQLFGGVVAPALFGVLIATHECAVLAVGYYAGGLLMLSGALVAWRIGLNAEGKSLEQLAPSSRLA
ncbi:MAG: hypothetical protein ACM3ZE_13810 [Myxococcales bacterium]